MKSVKIWRWGIMLYLLFVVQIVNGYSVKAGEREKDVEAYYAVVDELNEKYNSEITMPSISEFVNSKLYQLNVEAGVDQYIGSWTGVNLQTTCDAIFMEISHHIHYLAIISHVRLIIRDGLRILAE